MDPVRDALRLYLITDNARRPLHELLRIVERGMRGGVTAVQYREKLVAPQESQAAVRKLGELCARYGAPLLLNADILARIKGETGGVEAVLPEGATGVHLNVRCWSGRKLPIPAGAAIVGYSAHAIDEARAALAAGAHFVTYGPVFETPSKAGALPPIGVEQLGVACDALGDAAVVALGGIDQSNAGDVMRAGASGIAVIRAIMSAANPEIAARELRKKQGTERT